MSWAGTDEDGVQAEEGPGGEVDSGGEGDGAVDACSGKA